MRTSSAVKVLSKPITFSQAAEEELKRVASATPEVSLETLRTVYRRGACSTETRVVSRHEAGLLRVAAFVFLAKNGYAANSLYIVDNDLLSAQEPQPLTAALPEEHTFSTDEQAILAITEYLGLGYEAEPAVRAAWIRGVRDGESPYHRAVCMAQYVFESSDADLLPKT